MKVPVSWLNEFVDVHDIPIGELRQRLTLAGLEVEAVEVIGYPGSELPWDPEKVITAEVRAVRPHPNADRLVLAKVDYGGSEPEIVVTGAPSLYAYSGEQDLHLKVAFAWEGAELYDGHAEGWVKARLKKTQIRGEPSRAMVCSEKELGISEAAGDIIYLDDDTPVGVPLVEILGDYVLNFDIKGPFGHLQSVYGIAREAAALYSRPIKHSPLKAAERLGLVTVPEASFADLEIADPDLCPRYTATLIRNIEIKPSPLWMQMRLRHCGMRPISNIVDITNYVMLEVGQPLHAFDYDHVRPRPDGAQPTIVVRRAYPDEQMRTLDGELRTFDDQMLLITDGQGPVGVAGVMGGLESEVGDSTHDVLLEAASFFFLNIRRTAQQLKLQSEAGSRFGKRVDSELALPAAARAAELMIAYAGAVVDPSVGDVYPGKPEPRTIVFDPALADRLLGISIPVDEQIQILQALEYGVEKQGATLRVTVPSYRQDVTLPVDLVEEVGRVHGYDKFPSTLIEEELPPLRRNRPLEQEEHLRDLLVGLGLDEIITYSLIDPADEGRLSPDPGQAPTLPGAPVTLRNALSPERSRMRRTLLPGALRTVWANLRYLDRLSTFEIGRIYYRSGPPDVATGKVGVDEPRHLSILMTGVRTPLSWETADDAGALLDYYDLKGVVDALLASLSLDDKVTWSRGSHPSFHPGRCAAVSINGRELGVLGELHPLVREAFDLPEQPVLVLLWDVDALLSAAEEAEAVKKIGWISPFAPAHEDMALVVDEALPAIEVQRTILAAGTPLVTEAVLFDIYRGAQVGEGKKSLAFALSYQAPNRALSERDVTKLRQRIVKALQKQLGAKLRGA